MFDGAQLAQIASQASVSQDEARQSLSKLLSEVVDHFTPDGQLRPTEQLLASIDDYERQLPRSSVGFGRTANELLHVFDLLQA